MTSNSLCSWGLYWTPDSPASSFSYVLGLQACVIVPNMLTHSNFENVCLNVNLIQSSKNLFPLWWCHLHLLEDTAVFALVWFFFVAATIPCYICILILVYFKCFHYQMVCSNIILFYVFRFSQIVDFIVLQNYVSNLLLWSEN